MPEQQWERREPLSSSLSLFPSSFMVLNWNLKSPDSDIYKVKCYKNPHKSSFSPRCPLFWRSKMSQTLLPSHWAWWTALESCCVSSPSSASPLTPWPLCCSGEGPTRQTSTRTQALAAACCRSSQVGEGRLLPPAHEWAAVAGEGPARNLLGLSPGPKRLSQWASTCLLLIATGISRMHK